MLSSPRLREFDFSQELYWRLLTVYPKYPVWQLDKSSRRVLSELLHFEKYRLESSALPANLLCDSEGSIQLILTRTRRLRQTTTQRQSERVFSSSVLSPLQCPRIKSFTDSKPF